MDLDAAQTIFLELQSVLNTHQIRAWIDQGVLLSFYREHAFFPYDTDIDYGIRMCDVHTLLAVIPLLRQQGFTLWHHCNNIDLKKDGISISFVVYQRKQDRYLLVDTYDSPYWGHLIDVISHNGQNTVTKKSHRLLSSFASTPLKHLLRPIFSALWRLRGGKYCGYVTPARYYDELRAYPIFDTVVLMPHDTASYLAFKYGNWRVDKPDYDMWMDGALITEAQTLTFKPWRTVGDLL
jgi:hypothetical protein